MGKGKGGMGIAYAAEMGKGKILVGGRGIMGKELDGRVS